MPVCLLLVLRVMDALPVHHHHLGKQQGHTAAERQHCTLLLLLRYACRALHGDIAQAQREATLAGFRSGKFSVLVATEVAARGMDISGVELVVQVRRQTCTALTRAKL